LYGRLWRARNAHGQRCDLDGNHGFSGRGGNDGGRGGFSRAYLHHLQRCGEMLAPMLTSIHNLHYYLHLMREMRDALDGECFGAWRARFAAERGRGIAW